MQIKLFTIPVGDNGSALQEMNAFLRGNKVIEVENKLIGNENGAYWCFCVRYIERAFSAENGEQKRFSTAHYASDRVHPTRRCAVVPAESAGNVVIAKIRGQLKCF